MSAAHLVLNLLTALFAAVAAATYLIDHPYPRAQMEMKRLPLAWMPRLGAVLAAGSAGLLAGLAAPTLGTLASLGLVLYFVGALIAHMRVGSRDLVGWAVFFVTSVATFSVNVVHHGFW